MRDCNAGTPGRPELSRRLSRPLLLQRCLVLWAQHSGVQSGREQLRFGVKDEVDGVRTATPAVAAIAAIAVPW